MADTGNIFRRCSILHGQNGLVDQLAGSGANDVRAQHAVSCLIRQNLDETVGLVVRLGTGVGHEGELAHFVGNSLLLKGLLGFAHPRDLGMRVDHTGHTVVVNVNVTAVDALDGDHALILGLVGQHGAVNAIANGINRWHHGLERGINRNATAIVLDNAHTLQAKAFGVGTTSHAHQ